MRTKPLFTTLLLIIISVIVFQCGKDSPDQSALLPRESATGANNFGCLVDKLALLPRDEMSTFSNPYPHQGIEPVINNDHTIIDINVYNGKAKTPTPFFLDMYLVDLDKMQPGNYEWKQTSYGSGIFSDHVNQVFGSFYDSETGNYEWFGSYDSSGTTTITRIDTVDHIIAGTFSGTFRKRDGTKEITITKGRFDLNWATVYDKVFP